MPDLRLDAIEAPDPPDVDVAALAARDAAWLEAQELERAQCRDVALIEQLLAERVEAALAASEALAVDVEVERMIDAVDAGIAFEAEIRRRVSRRPRSHPRTRSRERRARRSPRSTRRASTSSSAGDSDPPDAPAEGAQAAFPGADDARHARVLRGVVA